MTERFQAYGQGIGWGWLTRAEVRKAERKKPLDAKFGLDEPLAVTTMLGALSGDAMNSPPIPSGQAPDKAHRAPRTVKRTIRVIEYRTVNGGAVGADGALRGMVTPFGVETVIGDLKSNGFREEVAPGTFTQDATGTRCNPDSQPRYRHANG